MQLERCLIELERIIDLGRASCQEKRCVTDYARQIVEKVKLGARATTYLDAPSDFYLVFEVVLGLNVDGREGGLQNKDTGISNSSPETKRSHKGRRA